MNIALFGGTFDPIHAGHMQAVGAAASQFRLDRILFVPTGNPPHKYPDRLTPFFHRYCMVVLACVADPRFIPSLLEAPSPEKKPSYSIDTVRRVRHSLGRNDHLFFLAGVDAFLDVPHWKDYELLLDLVDFIVVSRPGFDAGAIRAVVPAAMLLPGHKQDEPGMIRLRRSTLHILPGVNAPVASHDIRKAVAAGRPVTGLVPPLVEEYISKEDLYLPRPEGKQK